MALDLAAKRALFDAVGPVPDRGGGTQPRACPAGDVQPQHEGGREGVNRGGSEAAQRPGPAGLVPSSTSSLLERPFIGESAPVPASVQAVVQRGDLAPASGPQAGLGGAFAAASASDMEKLSALLFQDKFARYQLRGRWLRDDFQKLRNAAWLVRNTRVGRTWNPAALALFADEAKKLSEAGEEIFDIVEALAELLVHP